MEPSNPVQPKLATDKQIMDYMIYLRDVKNMPQNEIHYTLLQQGVDQVKADNLMRMMSANAQNTQVVDRDKAMRDIIFGLLWCVGGIVATVADIGFIFWGAIVFGGFQFIRGLVNLGRSSK